MKLFKVFLRSYCHKRKYLAAILAGIVTFCCPIYAKPDTLLVQTPQKRFIFSQQQLLGHPGLKKFAIDLPAYPGKKMHVNGLEVCALFSDLVLNAHHKIVEIVADDGYVDALPASYFYPCSSKLETTPILLIEEPSSPWPKLTDSDHSAGSFYLIWLGKNKKFDWIYQVNAFKVLNEDPFSSLERLPLPINVRKGLEVFKENCRGCHRLNGQGNALMAHDLNNPNPLTYFSKQQLRAFLNNPQVIRPGISKKMPRFTSAQLSNQDFDSLVSLLQYFAHISKTTPPA